MSGQLSPETVRRIEALFPRRKWANVSQLLLSECGNNLPFLEKLDEFELERFRFAALKVSEGSMDRLEDAIRLAQKDWRDLLVAAGFANDTRSHGRWFPTRLLYPCPCCGYLVFDEAPGSDDICPICLWEDDLSQLRFVRLRGGANRPCLIEAQQNYQQIGVSNPSLKLHGRPAGSADVREDDWRLFDPAVDNPEEPVRGTDYGQTYPEDSTQLYYWRRSYWRRA